MNESSNTVAQENWNKVKQFYLTTLSSSDERNQVSRYFETITSVDFKDGVFSITFASSYTADFVREKYADNLKKCLDLVFSEPVKIDFKHEEKAPEAIALPPEVTAPTGSKIRQTTKISTLTSTMPLNSDYTFEEFVEGSCNCWALAAAQGIVANPGKAGSNPFFIHGGTGLGKTHLMQAIGNELKKKDPTLNICYLTAEVFMNEFLNALQNNTKESFRNRYRKMDLLMVDDVQFFQKGTNVQEEFFNTFNALQQAHKQIVMTSDVAPKNLKALEERLISRFEGGMVQEIESPNYETRLAILRKKSESLGTVIPDNALQYIAETIKSHVRAMEGALNRVEIFRKIEPSKPLTDEILAYILKDFIEKEKSIRNLTILEIQQSVAKRYNVTLPQILSSERTQSLVTPRQLAMYIARKYTMKSLAEVAKDFQKTHATIIHGTKAIKARLETEPSLMTTLDEILTEFGISVNESA
jgi:chromosomal replication initiator protein